MKWVIVLLLALLPGAAMAEPVQRCASALLTLTDANTEYSYSLPSQAKAFAVKARTNNNFKYAWQATESGSNYITVPAGSQMYNAVEVLLNAYRTIYFQSATAALILEIEACY